MRQNNWDDLKLFLIFSRTGTTRAAGELLGISHSTVARKMELLSESAGAKLYHRNSSGLQLTEQGQELFDTAVRIEDEVANLERRFFGQSQELVGSVTLSTTAALSIDPFMSVLAEFRSNYPKIDLRFITTTALTDLDRREADLALRFGESPDEHLVGRKLAGTARAVYASRDYVRKLFDNGDTADLGWISFSPEGVAETWKKNTTYPNLPTTFRSADMRTQQSACRAGMGIVMLPCFMCDPDPELCRITEPEFVSRQDLWLLRHSDMRRNARVRALSRFLTSSISKLLPLLHGQTAETVEKT